MFCPNGQSYFYDASMQPSKVSGQGVAPAPYNPKVG